MRKKLKLFDLVEIKWVDSMSARGWRTPLEVDEQFAEEVVMTSVGYFYKQTKAKTAIVGCYDSQNPPTMNRYFEVPTSAILSIRRLK